MYVCLCNGVTEKDIRRHVAEGACCLEDLAGCTGVGTGCGRCLEVAATVLAESTHVDPVDANPCAPAAL